MSVKKIVQYVKNKPVIRYSLASLLVIIGLAGIIIPLAQGLPLLLVGLFMFNPNNKKLSKKIFKHEKVLNYTFYGSLILFIIPAFLFGTGIISVNQFTEEYAQFSTKVTQFGKSSFENFNNQALSIFDSSSEEIQKFCIVCKE